MACIVNKFLWMTFENVCRVGAHDAQRSSLWSSASVRSRPFGASTTWPGGSATPLGGGGAEHCSLLCGSVLVSCATPPWATGAGDAWSGWTCEPCELLRCHAARCPSDLCARLGCASTLSLHGDAPKSSITAMGGLFPIRHPCSASALSSPGGAHAGPKLDTVTLPLVHSSSTWPATRWLSKTAWAAGAYSAGARALSSAHFFFCSLTTSVVFVAPQHVTHWT
jgi:hypothetical protein